MVLFWVIVFAVLLIIEFMTFGLTTIWFAIGALFAILASILNFNLTFQLVFFFGISFFMLLFTRPIALKYWNNKTVKTNVDEVIGQKAIVTEKIVNIEATGAINYRGQIWSARNIDDKDIEVDSIVKIIKIKGVTLYVQEI